jgi:hypothetical protein
MRLKPGTILTFLGALAVIIAGIVLTNQQGTTPAATATPTVVGEGAGPLFPTIADPVTQAGIVRFEVQDVTAATKIIMVKDTTTNNWAVTESGVPGDQGTDQTAAVAAMSRLAGLNATQSFPLGDTPLANFGLDAPNTILILTDSAGATYTVRVGAANVATRRYYALVNDDTATVYVINQTDVDNLKGQITSPPYLPTATPTVTFTPSPNPFSEVDQTATAVVEQTATMNALMTVVAATAESTAEATAEATADAAAAGTSAPAASSTPIPPPSATVPAAAAASNTPVPPTATVAPSNTPVPPTATVAPSNTPVPPTATVAPSNTPVPSATNTATPRPSRTPVPSSRTPMPTVNPTRTTLTPTATPT